MSIKEQFYVPLEIRTRKGRGGDFHFVEWQDVANRLNEVLGISWSSEIKSSEIVGDNIIVRVRVSFIDPEMQEHHQEGFGGAVNDDRLEAGSPFKAAYSKALKDACKKWGIGLYLEDEGQPSFGSAQTITDSTVKKSNTPPMSETTIPAQSIPSNTSIPAFSTRPVQIPPTQTQTAVTPTPPMFPTPPPMPVSNPPVQTPFAVAETVNTGPLGISDIQKVALGGIMSSKGISFEELAREAFTTHSIVKDPFPSRDDLTYDEAVLIIKYGNDKYRKL